MLSDLSNTAYAILLQQARGRSVRSAPWTDFGLWPRVSRRRQPAFEAAQKAHLHLEGLLSQIGKVSCQGYFLCSQDLDYDSRVCFIRRRPARTPSGALTGIPPIVSHIATPGASTLRTDMEQSNPFRRRPKRTIADVLAISQNEEMERFAVLRQALAFRTKPPPAQTRGQAAIPRDEATPGGRLAGILVLLIPLAGVAWLGIGWLVYRLVT